MNIILFGIYLFILLVVFAFIAIITIHIGNFRQYSKYLSVVLKIYLVTVLIIGIFGGYMILTSKYIPLKKMNPSTQKLNF